MNKLVRCNGVLHFVATFSHLPILDIFLSHYSRLFQRVTTKQAVAPAPTDQTQPLVGEFQVGLNDIFDQF